MLYLLTSWRPAWQQIRTRPLLFQAGVGFKLMHTIEYSESISNYKVTMYCVALSGQQTLVELHASRTNEDVRMYT